jgi:ATP-dependent DNA helicase PIF1
VMHRYANGTLCTVVGFEKESGNPIVKTNAGRTINVEADEWRMEDGGKILARIEQIPLRLAWAMTVHKSQGMSLDAAHMDLSQTFEYGQGYVALSCVRSLAGLSLAGLNARALEVHPEIRAKDAEFRAISKKAQTLFAEMPKEEIAKMHKNFIRACGGQENAEPQKEVEPIPVSRLDKLREKFPNAGRPWNEVDDALLKKMFAEDKPQKEMATHFGRKPSAIHARLGHFGLVEDYWVNRRKAEAKKKV